MIAKKQSGRPSRKPHASVLLMLYENTTAREIAEQYRVSISTVRRWIRESREEAGDK